MKKLTKEQKELILQKLEESGQFPNLVQKARQNPEEGGDDKEWNKARKKVVSSMMRESNSRFFKVAPLLDKRVVKSKRTEWLYDNKENLGFLFIVIGTALIFLDPGTFGVRGDAPYVQGPMDYLALVQYILNWGPMGWMGAICMLGGYLFSRQPQLFLD